MKQRWKRIGSLFLALCMVVTMLPGAVFAADGDEFTDSSGLKYKVLMEDTGAKTGTVALAGYPIDSEPTGTLTVTEAVYKNGINYSITEIGEEAFSWCSVLTAVVIGDSVDTVGDGAFKYCEAMANVTLGDSIKTIGESAFQGTNMTSIHLPASVEVIGEDAFYGCNRLESFTVDEGNSYFSAEDGVLFSKDKKTLLLYPTGKIGKSYTIPSSVETIGERAFAGNVKLTHIDTKNAVTIGKSAFAGSALGSINIGDSVVTIGEDAFDQCNDLTEISFSENSSLETIGDNAFFMCEGLESIDLPASLKIIGGWAFGYCHSLESLWIGPLVDSIGSMVFFANKLAYFTVDPANEHYSSADNVLYDKNKTTLIRYMQGKMDTSFSIPDTVTKIEESAFYATDKLEAVTIPAAVNNIGNSAFYYSGIKSITFLGDTPPTTVGSGIFDNCNNLTDIYVPEGRVDEYKSALGDYAAKVTAQATIDQAGWEALIANNGAAINDGDIIILSTDVTGSLYRSNSLPNLTIDGNGHTINGNLYFAQKTNLTLKDIAIQGPDNWDTITFNNSNEGSRLITSGTVAISGGKGKGGLGFIGRAGVYSDADLTITASDETTITAGDADEEYNFSLSAVWVGRGSLTLDGGSPTFRGGKGYSSYGADVGKTEYPGDLIITSGSPKFIGGSLNDIGSNGANVTGTIRISSTGSPEFIGADGKGDINSRTNGARAGNLEITAGTPIFKGGSASGSELGSFAGYGIDLSDSATISGTASPTFTGGDGAASECGGAGLIFWGGLTVFTSGDVTFTGGSNCRYAIEEGGGGSATKTGINLKDLKGKITADNTKGRYGAIGLFEGSISYPDGLAETKKYNGTDKMYVLDIGDTTTTYTAMLNINLDGSPFTSQFASYTLKLDGNESTTVAMTGTRATRTADVANGIWKVYEGSTYYTGVNITVNNAPTSATLNYYTVNYSVTKQGTVNGGIINLSVVTLGGDDLDNKASGSNLLKGDKATFTATGTGAESYNYAWSGTHGGETISGSGSIYKINSVQGKVDITCTITGSGTSSAPVPGNLGTITVTDITQNSLTLNWTNATSTVQGSLKYAVFQSTSANISTVGECTSHQELLLNGPDNINTYAVSGLSPNTTYYFNIVVTDNNMGMAAYTMVSATTTGGSTAPTITVTKHPQNVTVTQGAISGTLTTEAVASNGKPVSYQWFRHVGGIGSDNTETLIGETSNTLVIPKGLIAGTYRYICSCTADGCDIVYSNATVTVKASGSGNEDNGGGGNGGNGGGSSSGGNTTAPTTTTPENKPNQPITAAAPVTAIAGTGGTASAIISDKAITDAIARAKVDAKAQGKTAKGTSVALNVTMPQSATSLTATLTQSSLNSLVNAGVTSLEINGAPVSLGLDLNALKKIQKQSGGNITISIAPATGLSNEAKALIGNRPVYNITISTVKDGKTVSVTSLGNGTATLSIPYTPGKNEAVGYLFGVYVDGKGKATRIDGSAYDPNARAILIPTGHFSVYGVGYTAPSAKFTDISTHWGKEAIDYVVGRALLSGTSETTFAPNTAMTRGMLVTALGRLAGVDVKTYTTNSFTDVKADSAFRPYIEWAYSKGVVQGIGNSQFAPDRAITREEIAIIFANYAKATGYKLPITREATAYADADRIGSVYKTAVTAMQQAGIMMGGTDNKFNPKASATRAEVSAMLQRYIKLTIDGHEVGLDGVRKSK